MESNHRSGRRTHVQLLGWALATLLMSACGNKQTFSLVSEQNSFSQTPEVIEGKIDILFMVDNSGSMQSSQENLVNNMEAFIESFQQKGLDFQMAVTTSDAYRAGFTGNQNQAKYRDGTDQNGHTGTFVIHPQTPNLTDIFLKNLLQGVNGNGDERVFQSLKETLTNPVNEAFGFPRKDAFLAIIILSDEDDFSHDGQENRDNQYTYAGLHTVQSYIDWFDQFTMSTGASRQYNINTISILDDTCLKKLSPTPSALKIGQRYVEASAATKGITGSLCDNFGTILSNISNRIIQLSTKFPLNRKAHPNSIRVYVNGQLIPNSAENGWVYNEADNSIGFPGSFTPPAGAAISVTFDPTQLR